MAEKSGDKNSPQYEEGHILLKTTQDLGNSINVLTTVNGEIGATISFDYTTCGIPGLVLVNLPENMSVEKAISYYTGKPGISYAEPDYYMHINTLPDDPDLWRQWGLSNTGAQYRENVSPGIKGADIHAPGGWNFTTGTNGAVIAVIDTGVDVYHPDLSSNLWTWNQSGIVIHGYNVLTSDWSEPWDDNNHGTHCAGIVGMVGNNGQGGAGVAWNTSIMAIKAFNRMGSAKISDIIAGMAYASSQKVPVISCSFGNAYYPSRAMAEFIESSPSLFVCAAGNEAIDTTTDVPFYPACYNLSNVIAVASTDAMDNLSYFSNYGNQTIHVAAPGSQIYSSLPSEYFYNVFWEDPEFSPGNITCQGNWTLEAPDTPGDLPVLHGVIPSGSMNTSLIIESNVTISAPYDIPDLVFDAKGDAIGTMRVEYSIDGYHWEMLEDNYGWLGAKDWTHKFVTFNTLEKGKKFRFRVTYYLSYTSDEINISIRNIRAGYRELVANPGYGYMNGSSMATPMVSGIAGLIKGASPDLTAAEIKQVIMNTVDPLPSLNGKIITGGRINMTAALLSLQKGNVMSLTSGWNHVSVPRNLANGSDTTQIFGHVNSSGHSILMYQDDTTGYRTLNATDPITPLQGYWLFSENATSVPIRFAEHVVGPSRQVPSGWSSIGGWAVSDENAKKTFSSLETGWSYVVGYNADTQQYEEPIIRDGTGNQSDQRFIHPYQGYWLYCTRNGTYHGPLT